MRNVFSAKSGSLSMLEVPGAASYAQPRVGAHSFIFQGKTSDMPLVIDATPERMGL